MDRMDEWDDITNMCVIVDVASVEIPLNKKDHYSCNVVGIADDAIFLSTFNGEDDGSWLENEHTSLREHAEVAQETGNWKEGAQKWGCISRNHLRRFLVDPKKDWIEFEFEADAELAEVHCVPVGACVKRKLDLYSSKFKTEGVQKILATLADGISANIEQEPPLRRIRAPLSGLWLVSILATIWFVNGNSSPLEKPTEFGWESIFFLVPQKITSEFGNSPPAAIVGVVVVGFMACVLYRYLNPRQIAVYELSAASDPAREKELQDIVRSSNVEMLISLISLAAALLVGLISVVSIGLSLIYGPAWALLGSFVLLAFTVSVWAKFLSEESQLSTYIFMCLSVCITPVLVVVGLRTSLGWEFVLIFFLLASSPASAWVSHIFKKRKRDQ